MSNMEQKWGIDLIGRRMWYIPWPFDEDNNYRIPTKEERENIFCKSGEAVKEVLLYFEECNGDTDELINLLNDHCIDSRFYITRNELINESRWYSNEYYFYFVMFTKKIIGRIDFHFGENNNTELSKYHCIYEKGFIEKIPWGVDENGKLIRDNSSENFCNTYNYIFKNYKNNKIIFDEIIILLNLFLTKQKNKYFDISLCLDPNYWFTNELLCYFYSFFQILTNDNKILHKAYSTVTSPLLLAMGQVLGSIKNIYKNIPILCTKYNNVTQYEIVKLKNNFCIVRYYSKKNETIDKYILNIEEMREMTHIAVLTSIPNAFNNSPRAICKINKSYLNKDDLFECELIWKNKISFTTLILIFSNIFIIAGIFFFKLGKINLVIFLFLIILLLINIIYLLINKNIDFLNFHKLFRMNFEKINKSKDELTERLLNERDMLEHKVHERTLELAGKNEKLKELDNAKTNFIANISHEFRTPLTLILGPLKSIIQGNYGKRIANTDNIFNTIQNNAFRLLKLINNLLDITKITTGKMNVIKEQIDLVGFIKIFILNVKDSCSNRNIKLSFESKLTKLIVNLDINLFETVLFNIFGNAFKFTPDGGSITISLCKDNGFFELSILDTGIGISEDQHDVIFERFGQADKSINKITNGTGIGLALTKQIVELHDGKIYVESKPGKGSIFSIKIPIIFDNVIEEIKEIFTINDELLNEFNINGKIKNNCDYKDNKKSILIVEDNKDMLEYLVNSMNKNYNVYHAINGKDALEKLKTIPKLDLIISDVMMEIMNGYDFINKLYKKEKFINIPLIFLTAKTTSDDKIKGLSMGAIDYISKPFDMNELLLKVYSIIQNKEINKRLIAGITKSKILKEIKKNVDENFAVNFEENCRIYNITEREKDVIKLLIKGKMYKEICWELNISQGTIKTHIKNIYQKCNVQTKIELINALKKDQEHYTILRLNKNHLAIDKKYSDFTT